MERPIFELVLRREARVCIQYCQKEDDLQAHICVSVKQCTPVVVWVTYSACDGIWQLGTSKP
jgi:hypothetical protein